MLLRLRFGNDVVHNDVDHGSSGEGEAVGKDGDDEADEEGAKHSGNGLDETAQLPVPARRKPNRKKELFAYCKKKLLCSHHMLLHVENPAALSGRLTARPSGKF
jgi:hypothetical protein